MDIAFLLHLYQPPQQHAYVVHDIAKSCYLPLLKLLKYKKEFNVTLNVPLSLLEWFEKERIDSFVPDVRALVGSKRVELTGSAAFHPILTKISAEEVERQIILNESGLGYYLGQTQGFEGEPTMMIKNVAGFFPPELAINEEVGKTLDSLGYEWVVVDEAASTPDKNHVNRLKGTNVGLAIRNKDLSLCLAFKRDDDPEEFMKGLYYLAEQGFTSVFIALDGETFGHHNPSGIDLLENLIAECVKDGHTFSTYSSVVSRLKSKKETDIRESCWGSSTEQNLSGNVYSKWYLEGNEIHESFINLEKLLTAYFAETREPEKSKHLADTLGNLPLWNFNKVSNASEISLEEKTYMKARIMFDKALNSDKYWWSSRSPEFDTTMIKRSLELFMRVLEKNTSANDNVIKELKELRDKILSVVKASA